MSIYAKGTSVSVERSEAELRGLLRKYGADAIIAGEDSTAGRAFVAFRITGRNVRLDIPLPKREDFREYVKKVSAHRTQKFRRDDQQLAVAHEQACRERWRAIVLLTKAKLEAIAMGLSSVEREFMHDLMTANGQTVGEMLRAGHLEELLGPLNTPLLPSSSGDRT